MNGLHHVLTLTVIGSCFVGFSIGGAILSAIAFPAITLFSRDALSRQKKSQWVIHKSFYGFVQLLKLLRLISLNVRGAERLAGPSSLILANHPTILDVVIIVSLMPEATCVVKKSLWNNPFLGGVVRAAGYIKNLDPENTVSQCSETIRRGGSIVMFPEGTRSHPGEPLHFLRGAAHVALQNNSEITPVVIQCDPPFLFKGARWYKIPPLPLRFRISVMPPMPVSEFGNISTQSSGIAARNVTAELERYFMKELRDTQECHDRLTIRA